MDSRARGSSISRRLVCVATTRGNAKRDTILVPFPSTGTPVAGSVVAALVSAVAVAVARPEKYPAGNSTGLALILELSVPESQ